MKKKKSLFSRALQLLTYKDSDESKEFSLPEYSETGRRKKEDTELNNISSTNNKSKVKETDDEQPEDEKNVSRKIDDNIAFIKSRFNAPTNKDIVIREFNVANGLRAFIVYLDGMINNAFVNDFILRPLLALQDAKSVKDECKADFIIKNVLEVNQTKKITVPDEVILDILTGNTGVYLEGCDYYVFCDTKGFAKRGVDKPQTEGVVRGSQEAFTEDLRTNISLIRRIIKSSELTTEIIRVGKRNNNSCAIMYIHGLTNPAIVREVKRRLKNLSTDAIIGDGMLEQFIEDKPYSLIPTVLTTERPDRTSAHILEGKVAIITDGSPFAMVVPVTIYSLMHSPEDAGLRWQHGTMLRLIRLFGITVATLLPALYVAVTNYHREMIPTDLLVAIVMAKENVPFPTVVEVLLMEVSFELIREAGIRIPGLIGNTLGIIGALILGQAAVEANIVSPVLIIVIAVTGLGNFAIPNFSLAFGLRIIRFLFVFVAAALGFYGITLLMVVLYALLANMKSFGVPFTSITAPRTRRSNDLVLRMPVWMQTLRPDPINPLDTKRQSRVSRKWTRQTPDKRGEE